MNKNRFLLYLVLAACLCANSLRAQAGVLLAQDGKAQLAEIIQSWQNYVSAISSFEVETLTSLEYAPASLRKNNVKMQSQHCVQSKKFFSSLTYVSNDPVKYSAYAFDGTKYRSRTGSLADPQYYESINPFTPGYLSPDPLSYLFSFVFEPGVAPTFSTLQNAKTWAFLKKRSTAWQLSEQNGKVGYSFSVFSDADKSKAKRRYEIFVDGESSLPLMQSVYNNQTGELEATLLVTQERVVMNGGAKFEFPIAINAVGYYKPEDDELYRVIINLKSDPETLKINQPINDSQFVIDPEIPFKGDHKSNDK